MEPYTTFWWTLLYVTMYKYWIGSKNNNYTKNARSILENNFWFKNNTLLKQGNESVKPVKIWSKEELTWGFSAWLRSASSDLARRLFPSGLVSTNKSAQTSDYTEAATEKRRVN